MKTILNPLYEDIISNNRDTWTFEKRAICLEKVPLYRLAMVGETYIALDVDAWRARECLVNDRPLNIGDVM